VVLVAACISRPPRCLPLEPTGSKQPRQESSAGSGPRKDLVRLRPSTGSDTVAVADVVELVVDAVSTVVVVTDLAIVAVEEDDKEDEDAEDLLILELLVVDDIVDKLLVDVLVSEEGVVVLFVLGVGAVEFGSLVLVDVSVDSVVLVDDTVDFTEVLVHAELLVVAATKGMEVPVVVEVLIGPRGAEQMGSRKL